MGLNAARAQKLEPPGIDINFGCPSKTVNKSDGGSVLLKEPSRIGAIVGAVRDAVDPKIPVTAKIRLGFSHHDFHVYGRLNPQYHDTRRFGIRYWDAGR